MLEPTRLQPSTSIGDLLALEEATEAMTRRSCPCFIYFERSLPETAAAAAAAALW